METTIALPQTIPSPWRTIWFAPRQTVRRIVDGETQPSWWPVIALVCTAQALGAIQFDPNGAVWPSASAVPVVLGPLQTVFSVLIGPFILAFVGGWLGGDADPSDIRPAVAWSQVPYAVVGACWIPVALSYRGSLSQPGTELPFWVLLLTFAVLASVLWSLVLQVISLSEVQKFSILRALASLIIPIIPLLILRLL